MKYDDYDNSELKYNLMREFGDWDKEEEPKEETLPVSDVWGRVKGWMLAGTGKVTNPDKDDPKACGKFYGVKGCLNLEGHNHTTLDGVNHRGMMFGRKRFRYCDNPRCATCYKHGWATREARRAEARFLKARKRYGKEEHLVVSQPREDECLTETPESEREYRRTKLKNALDSRGIMGGSIAFHPLRYADHEEAEKKGVPFGWRYSPHYHVTGFIKGGYHRCRACSHNNGFDREEWCKKCEGFEGRTRRRYAKDGFIVKIAKNRKKIFKTTERISTFATLRYQLDHCGVPIEEKKYHVITWFGVMSYRALKLTKEDFEEVDFKHNLCPLCQKPLEDLECLDASEYFRLKKEFWVKEFEEPLYDKDGKPRWKIKDRKGHSGSYKRFSYE